MRIVITSRAEADLEAIFDYIRQDSPPNATAFVRRLREKIVRIAHAPRIYGVRDALAPGLRVAVHGNYLILFRLEGSAIEITRIVHGARSLDELSND